jgi:hypothetical protein
MTDHRALDIAIRDRHAWLIIRLRRGFALSLLVAAHKQSIIAEYHRVVREMAR